MSTCTQTRPAVLTKPHKTQPAYCSQRLADRQVHDKYHLERSGVYLQDSGSLCPCCDGCCSCESLSNTRWNMCISVTVECELGALQIIGCFLRLLKNFWKWPALRFALQKSPPTKTSNKLIIIIGCCLSLAFYICTVAIHCLFWRYVLWSSVAFG